ncbi:MAG TPA: serine hydrolase domain-containing protein [Microlunatus sp.]|nr:serine hydrolase domain-containing protein [Microlunatus sp.]
MKIDAQALATATEDGRLSGVVTVDAGEERLYEACHGYAHRGLAVPTTVGTRFALASATKIMTALGVLRLVEEGAIRLTDPVRPILGGDLPLIDDAVTIEHLLGHTSGIGDYLDEEAAWEPADYVLPVPVHTLADTEAFVRVIDGYPQVSPPGERFAYNNGGYVVLALITDRLAESGYHDWVEQQVCARAGLERTSYLRSDELPGDAALGYLFDEGDRTNVLHLPVRGTGDGGIYSTVDDLHRFWRSLVAGQIVGPDLVQTMITPRNVSHEEEKLRYGLGCWLHPTGPALIVEGYDAGISMRSIHDPATQTTATVLANSSEGAWRVAWRLVEMFG